MSVGRGQAGRQACGEGGREAQRRCAVLCCARPARWKAASLGTAAVLLRPRTRAGGEAAAGVPSQSSPLHFFFLGYFNIILIHYLVFSHS